MSQAPPLRVRARPPMPERHVAMVNVMPLINVLLGVVPFLLLCTAAHPLAAYAIDAPQAAAVKVAQSCETRLRIEPSAFVLEVKRRTGMRESTLMTATVARSSEATTSDRVVEQLHDRILRLNSHFPGCNRLIVLPDETIAYEDVIDTMDIVSAQRQVSGGGRLFASVVLGSTLP